MNCVTAMKPYAQEAEVLRLLLLTDRVDVRGVIKWADQIIGQTKETDHDLIDLSLISLDNPYNVVLKISDLANGANKPDAIRTVLGCFYDLAVIKQFAELFQMISVLERMVFDYNGAPPPDLAFLWITSDGLEGYLLGGPSKYQRELLDKLKYFHDAFPCPIQKSLFCPA